MSEAMVSVAICDDEKEFLQFLKEKMMEELDRRGVKGNLVTFESAQGMLEAFREGMHFDLYCLDIDMPGINGMEAARTIRSKDPEAVLSFVSSLEEMVFESFEVRPVSFIRKSHIHMDLSRTLDLFFEDRQERGQEQGGCYLQDDLGHAYEITFSKTLYLEAEDKYIRVVTEETSFLIRSSIAAVEKALSDCGFVRTHRSYLVNLRKIYSIGSDHVLLDDGRKLPLARGRTGEVRRRFALEM